MIIIFIEIFLCLIIMIGSFIWNADNAENYSYFIPNRNSVFVEGIFSFFTVFLLLATMIPISLIISLEMVKFT